MVGTVLSTSPMCSLYKMVVLPAASRPSMTALGHDGAVRSTGEGRPGQPGSTAASRTRICFRPNTRSTSFFNAFPMAGACLHPAEARPAGQRQWGYAAAAAVQQQVRPGEGQLYARDMRAATGDGGC